MKYYWFNKICCVPGCGNTSTEGKGCVKEYFDLPAEPQARAKWLKAVLTKDGENLKVCEDHFKDDDIFRDKSNRKKLRLNSVPSTRLPTHICKTCLCTTVLPNTTGEFKPTLCTCLNVSTNSTSPLSPALSPLTIKKSRIRWSQDEKKILFRAIKDYGDAKFNNSQVRINWANVVARCRSNGCFGNEKELRTVWQNMRVNAAKVYKNDIFGSKLDRKVSRFIYGRPQNRSRNVTEGSSSLSDCPKRNMEVLTTDEDEGFREPPQSSSQYFPTDEEKSSGAINECETATFYNDDLLKTDTKKTELKNDSSEGASVDDDSDEYYSITDVEEVYNIKIRPTAMEVISLLSSDEE